MYIYTVDTLIVWYSQTVVIDIIGQSTLYMLNIYIMCSFELLHF